MKKLFPVLLIATSFLAVSCDWLTGGSSGSKKDNVNVKDINIEVKNVQDHQKYYSLTFQALSQSKIPLTGLEDAHYEIRENGYPISENTFKPRPNPKEFSHDILLLLDFSGSVTDDCINVFYKNGAYTGPEENYISYKCYQVVNSSINFAKSIIDEAENNNASISVYYLNGKQKITLLTDKATDINTVKSAVTQVYSQTWRDQQQLNNYRSTNLYGGVQQGLQKTCEFITGEMNGNCSTNNQIFSAGVYKGASLVVFTDGREEARYKTFEQMQATLADNLTQNIYTVGLGSQADETVLKEIGRNGYQFAATNQDLGTAFDEIANQLNNLANSHYAVNFCTAAQVGDIKVEVDITTKDGLTSSFKFDVSLGNAGNRGCQLPIKTNVGGDGNTNPTMTLAKMETLLGDLSVTVSGNSDIPMPEMNNIEKLERLATFETYSDNFFKYLSMITEGTAQSQPYMTYLDQEFPNIKYAYEDLYFYNTAEVNEASALAVESYFKTITKYGNFLGDLFAGGDKSAIYNYYLENITIQHDLLNYYESVTISENGNRPNEVAFKTFMMLYKHLYKAMADNGVGASNVPIDLNNFHPLYLNRKFTYITSATTAFKTNYPALYNELVNLAEEVEGPYNVIMQR